MTSTTEPRRSSESRPSRRALSGALVQACDQAADLKDLISAIEGLAEGLRAQGGRTPAHAGMLHLATIAERAMIDLHDDLDAILDMARGSPPEADDEPEAEEGPKRAAVTGVLAEMCKLHLEAVDLVRDLAGRVEKLEAERAPEPPA